MKVPVAVGCLLSLGMMPAQAVDWTVEPRVKASAEYNDNNRMSEVPGAEIEVAGAALDAQVMFGALTERTRFRLTPRLRSTFYPSDSSEEANDQFLRMDLDHNTERARAFFDSAYSRIDTLGDYFPGAEIGEDDQVGNPETGTGVGRFGAKNREDRLRIKPGVTYEMTERQSIEVEAEYLDVGYDREIPGDRVGFQNLMALLAYRVRTSQTASLALRTTYNQYEPDDDESTDSYAIEGEWVNRPTDVSELFVRAGARNVEVQTNRGSDWESGFSGGTGIRWKFEVTELFFDYNHYLDPNSSGRMVNRDQLRFQLRRQLAPMTFLSVSLRGIKDSDAPGDNDFVGREYVTGEVGLRWRMTRTFTLFGRYRYSWREYDEALNDAASNAISVGVDWQPSRK